MRQSLVNPGASGFAWSRWTRIDWSALRNRLNRNLRNENWPGSIARMTMAPDPATLPQPSLLGLRPSFGFGDRLGLATPGHVAACKLGRLAPIFAQQSARELTRTKRTATEVLRCAQEGVRGAGWSSPWGADADHLKTREDVEHYAAAGYTFYTIDPSIHVQNAADKLAGTDLLDAA